MKKVVKTEHAAGQRADRRALAEINDLIDDGVHDAASVLAWEVQRSSPGDPAVWLLLARIDYLRERYAAAIYAARMATRLAPSSPDAWFALASTAATRPRWYAEGLDAALQATALAPDRPKNWTVLAQLQLATGASYDAAVAAERAVAVDPEYRGGHLMLGEIALHAGEWEHAEAAFRRALALDPADRDARDGLTEALEALDREPDEELASLGAPPPREPQPVVRRLRPSSGSRQADPGRAPLSNRVMLVAVGSCLLAGLVLGLLVPGLGVIRGLVGAVAVVLMWIAVRPTRVGAPQRATDADPLAPDPAAATGQPPAVSEASAPSARGDRPPDGTPEQTTAARGEPAATVAARSDDDPGDGTADREVAASARSDDPVEVGRQAAAAARPDDPGEGTAAGVPSDDAARPPRPDSVGIDMPADPQELAALSQARLAAADLELAHAAASRLEAVAPGSVDAHRALAAVALAEHDYEQARTHYRRILELEPLDQEAHERLALVGGEAPRTGRRIPLRRLWGRQ